LCKLQTSFNVDLIFKGFDILGNEQFRFCPQIPTEIASYSLINKVAGIFFDLVKAFDCVNHKMLLYKVEFCCIANNVYRLLKLYLQNLYQMMKIKNRPFHKSESDWTDETWCSPGVYPRTVTFLAIYQ
jgi:hypothetical protein